MPSFDIHGITISWDIEEGPPGRSFVTERVSGMPKCFTYGPVPNDELEEFLRERKNTMPAMEERFRRGKLN
jgi:hypothetical protein